MGGDVIEDRTEVDERRAGVAKPHRQYLAQTARTSSSVANSRAAAAFEAVIAACSSAVGIVRAGQPQNNMSNVVPRVRRNVVCGFDGFIEKLYHWKISATGLYIITRPPYRKANVLARPRRAESPPPGNRRHLRADALDCLEDLGEPRRERRRGHQNTCSLMVIGYDKLDAKQAALLQPRQEIALARPALAIGQFDSEDRATSFAIDRQNPKRAGRC
jgi:hypothetical protein